MTDVNLHILSELKEFVSLISTNDAVLSVFKNTPSAFSRNRKLPFDKLVLLILKLCKKTLSVEIEQFYSELNSSTCCSVSAFTQQRSKLDPIFFYWWNIVLWSSYYHYSKDIKRWNGYRVIAADGSNISLIKTPSLQNYFGGQTNQAGFFVQAKSFYYYDVLNDLILYPEIKPYRYGEMKIAYNGIENLAEDMLAIYDRYFSNYKMIALHVFQEKERKFLIRANERSTFIKSFIESGQTSCVTHMVPTQTAIRELKKSGYIINKNTLIKVRLVRVELKNTVEVLITNLWEEEGHDEKQFKELYFMRWGIETNISFQKNIQQLESFSGLTVESVIQDFYATAFITNLHSLIKRSAQTTVDQKITHRKYPMKINGNKSYGKLKANLIPLFISNDPETILLTLHRYFIRDLLPVRKGRSFERIRKNPQFKSKHKTFNNYKPSF